MSPRKPLPRDKRDDGCSPYAAAMVALIVAAIVSARKARRS